MDYATSVSLKLRLACVIVFLAFMPMVASAGDSVIGADYSRYLNGTLKVCDRTSGTGEAYSVYTLYNGGGRQSLEQRQWNMFGRKHLRNPIPQGMP